MPAELSSSRRRLAAALLCTWCSCPVWLGRVWLGELTGRQAADMFHTLGSTNDRYGRPPTPTTLHRIRATLLGALNAAIREGLLRHNPARHIEVPSPRRLHAEVWPDPRVTA